MITLWPIYSKENRGIYVTNICRRNCVYLYKEEAPLRGFLPEVILFSVDVHLEGVSLFVALAPEVFPEVDLDHLTDRAACFFEKP